MKTFVLLLLSIWFSSSSFAESLIVDELSKKISADLFARFVIPDDPSFRFFQTPSQNWLIGLRQVFVVHAKPEKVAAILDDIKSYTGIFTGVKKAEFTEFKSLDEYTVFTETQVDFPFTPNDQTELSYRIKRDASKVLYRYTLKKSNSVKKYEGIIVLLAWKSGETLFFEYDAFEPELGMAKIIGEEKIWVESALGNLQSDWAVKMRAEHGDWSPAKILEMSEEKTNTAKRALRKLYAERLPADQAKILEINP